MKFIKSPKLSILIDEKVYSLQLIAFLLLQPLISIYRIFFENAIEIFGLSLPEILNLAFIGYLFLLFVIKNRKNLKILFPVLVYCLLFVIYFCLHIWNISKFDGKILNGSDINMFKEIYFISRTYLIPLVYFYLLINTKIENRLFEKGTYITAWFISLVIVLTNIFKVAFICYASSFEKNKFIEKNIIDWFINPDVENPAFMTSKGWFYIGNQIGIILFMLLPFTILSLIKNRKLHNFILLSLQIVAMIMVSTKVSAIGVILIMALALIIILFFSLVLKQFSFNAKSWAAFLLITLLSVGLFIKSPIIPMSKQRSDAFKEGINTESLEDEFNDFNKFYISSKDMPKEEVEKFTEFVEKYHNIFGIDKEFVKLFDVKDNVDFWLKIVFSGDISQMDFRDFKQQIYKEVLEKNNNPLDRYLGIGYTSNFPYSEQDIISQNIWFGYVGTVLLLGPYLLCMAYIIFKILKNLKRHFRFETIFYGMAIAGVLLLSLLAGHLFFEIFSIVVFAWSLAGFYNFISEKENIS